jgi:hypothetical protein
VELALDRGFVSALRLFSGTPQTAGRSATWFRETSLQKLSREFRKAGTRWSALKNIADTPFFVDSRASRPVQLADHVAYSVFRRYNSGDAQYMDIIASRFDEADGVIHGLCHKHAKRITCTCPGCLSRRLGSKLGEPGR